LKWRIFDFHGLLENHFQRTCWKYDFRCQGHFADKGELDCWKGEWLSWRLEPSSDEAPAVVSHPVEPTLPLGIARSIDHTQQGFTDWRHAGASGDAPFEPRALRVL
jgi:hypothetical protein